MKKILLLLGIILFCGFAFAESSTNFISIANGQELPGPIAAIFNGENVNFCVTGTPDDIIKMLSDMFAGGCYYAEIRDSKITNLQIGSRDNATMKVESSFGTLDQILGSKRPVNAFMQAKNSGAIKITSLNAFTGAKVTLGEFFASIYSFFEPN